MPWKGNRKQIKFDGFLTVGRSNLANIWQSILSLILTNVPGMRFSVKILQIALRLIVASVGYNLSNSVYKYYSHLDLPQSEVDSVIAIDYFPILWQKGSGSLNPWL